MDTSLASAVSTAKSINDCMNANMSAYVWWYIVRYYGPIGDGTMGQPTGSVTRKGYVMSQFSRFIRPGFYRVESSVYPPLMGTGVSVTAYKDPESSKIVMVAVNTRATAVKHVFRIHDGAMTKVTPYTTSENKNCEQASDVSVTNGSFTFTLEPSSITTFVSN